MVSVSRIALVRHQLRPNERGEDEATESSLLGIAGGGIRRSEHTRDAGTIHRLTASSCPQQPARQRERR
jgi:hypothetical protein